MLRIPLQALMRVVGVTTDAEAAAWLPRLDYPLIPAPRIAVMGVRVQQDTGVHWLAQPSPVELQRIRPLALAGRFEDLRMVADWMRVGEVQLPHLLYPTLVFRTAVAGPLNAQQHEELWRWFRLPSFEQIRGGDGRLLAQECEARDGFHLEPDVRAEEIGGWLTPGPCACGQTTGKVRFEAPKARAAAAGR